MEKKYHAMRIFTNEDARQFGEKEVIAEIRKSLLDYYIDYLVFEGIEVDDFPVKFTMTHHADLFFTMIELEINIEIPDKEE